MRRLGLILALIGASVLFLGAAPGTASAGNCTYVGFPSGPVSYDGAWKWQPTVAQCTGINGIDFGNGLGSPGVPPFLYDATHQAYHFPYSGGGNCISGGTISSCYTTYHNTPWGSGCGAPAFYVQAWFSYRIRSLPGTWGPWHTFGSGSQLIC